VALADLVQVADNDEARLDEYDEDKTEDDYHENGEGFVLETLNRLVLLEKRESEEKPAEYVDQEFAVEVDRGPPLLLKEALENRIKLGKP